jgi:hypothetical protein
MNLLPKFILCPNGSIIESKEIYGVEKQIVENEETSKKEFFTAIIVRPGYQFRIPDSEKWEYYEVVKKAINPEPL